MENNKRYEAGKNVMEELFSQEVRTGMEEMKEISPDFWNMIVSFGFGDLYAREALSLQHREYITLTTLITQGAFEQFKVHLQAALNIGALKRRNYRNHHPVCRVCRVPESRSGNGNRPGDFQ